MVPRLAESQGEEAEGRLEDCGTSDKPMASSTTKKPWPWSLYNVHSLLLGPQGSEALV